MGARMLAKDTYFLDENGKITTDAKKGVRRITRKGHFINPAIEKVYDLVDGEPAKPGVKTATAPAKAEDAAQVTESGKKKGAK
ncbi:MAG: hypothetical protein ABIW84_08710 [Ilumatobacteraceae bacterium]